MARQTHDTQVLVRYAAGDLSSQELLELENHLDACAQCRDFLSFVRNFEATLTKVAADTTTSDTTCPDSSLLVDLEAEALDEWTAQNVRAHLFLCKQCLEDFYALRQLRPKRVEVVLKVTPWSFSCVRFLGDAQYRVRERNHERQGARGALQLRPILSDSETGEQFPVTVRLEDTVVSGIPRILGRLRIKIQNKKIVPEWRASLLTRDRNEIVAAQLNKRCIVMHSPLAPGNYILTIHNPGDCLWEMHLTLETFTLNEAMKEAQTLLNKELYGAALNVLWPTIGLYPDIPELWKLKTDAMTAIKKRKRQKETEGV